MGGSGGGLRAAGRRLGAGALLCGLVGGVVVAGGGDVAPPAQLDLRGGGAWVASSAVGQLTLIDGGTAEVAARVAVAEPGGGLASVQDRSVGYALDRTLGVVRRIDPATFAAAPGVEVIDGLQGAWSVHPTGDALYVVDQTRGRVGVTDGASLSALRGEAQSLAEPVASSVVDAAGRLWVVGESSGDLTWFDGVERDARRGAVADPAGAELVTVDGAAALVERAGRTVRRIGGDGEFGAESCLEIDPRDDSIRVGGSDRAAQVYVVSGEDGVLRVSDLGSGACGDVVIEVAEPGNELGAPTEARGRVFVPDYTAGTVLIVDLESRDVQVTAELVVPGTAFELFDRDGIVFYNDPGSERAGVVRVDGSVAAVQKYDPERPGAGVVPEGGRDGVPDSDQAGSGEGMDGGAVGGEDPGGTDPGQPTDSGTGPTRGDPGGDQAGGDPTDPVADAAPGPADPALSPDPDEPPDPDDPGAPQTGGVEIAGPAAVQVGETATLLVRAVGGGTVSDAAWTFGDGDTATGTTVRHAWSTAHLFTVTVEATVAGERVSDRRHVEVLAPGPDPPVADFTITPATVDVGSPVTVRDLTRPAPTSWEWTFDRARGSGTSRQQNPPPQVWDTPGTYAVTLRVERAGESDEVTHTINVRRPPPTAPSVSAVEASAGPPFDTLTPYTFSATVTGGQATPCTFTVDGTARTCAAAADVAGGVRVSTSHQFATDGPKTIRLVVGVPGAATTVTRTITVVEATRPTAVIRVSGADGTGGYTALEGTQVVFDGTGSLPMYDELRWSDSVSGAGPSGDTWAPVLSPGPHTVTLTAVNPRLGDHATSVDITILERDRTAPEVETPYATGHYTEFVFYAAGRDLESGVVQIDIYGHISGTCLIGGVPVGEMRIGGPGALIASGPGSGTVTNRGEGWIELGPYIPTGCPEGTDDIADLDGRLWSIVHNGQGLTTRSEDNVITD